MTERRQKRPPGTSDATILVINCGSSSVKFALFSIDVDPLRVWSGAVERIGLPDGRFHAVDGEGNAILDQHHEFPDHEQALVRLLDEIERHPLGGRLTAVGHRVVHGGNDCDCPAVVTTGLEASLRELTPLAPLHQPHNLAGIEAVRRTRPDLPQVACFDTAFHHRLPRIATLTALPRKYYDQGIRRYGFHGISYEYIVDALRREGVRVEDERIIVAHLGNGASMCALQGGRSVETTMGFSTLAGLPMGTRCGDLDPGIVLYLLTERGISIEDVEHLLYEESGLLGLSGASRNMHDLLERTEDAVSAEAVEFYCYQARRHLAGLTATLGGLDRLVFTAGIGANSATVREKVCSGLAFLGVSLDPKCNESGARTISTAGSDVIVQAIPTDEELMIARHVRDAISARAAAREV